MTALTWRGLTADYSDSERAFMRSLATEHPDEAAVIHELKALLGARLEDEPTPAGDVWVYTWGNSTRRRELRGRRCVVEARGAKRTVRVRFLDNGERVTTDRYALRKAA